MGPKDRRNTGTDFQEQIDKLFRGEEDEEEDEEEDKRDGDKNAENDEAPSE